MKRQRFIPTGRNAFVGAPWLGLQRLEEREVLTALPVLLVVADQRDFYFAEYSVTRTALENRGVGVVVAATTTNPSTPHMSSGQPAGSLGTINPDIALMAVDPDDYSAIVFVGGWGSSQYQYAFNDPNLDGAVDNFYADSFYNGDTNLNDGQIAPQKIVVNNLINDFLQDDKPVAAICHGVTVLAWARVDGMSPLSGKQVAVPHLEGAPDQFYNGMWHTGGYLTGQRDQVADNGGLPTLISGAYGDPTTVADDVIVDGRIITAENYDSANMFGDRIAQQVIASLPPAKVTSVVVGDGTNQRSMVTKLTVTFSQPIAFVNTPVSAFTLIRQSDNLGVTLDAEVDSTNTVVTLTFTGGAVHGQSLDDGRFTMHIHANQIGSGRLDGNGDGIAGDNYELIGSPTNGPRLFRLYGDADGNGSVNAADFAAFRLSFGTASTVFSNDGDGLVDATDFNLFRTRYGTAI